jgi:hypothetical protein
MRSRLVVGYLRYGIAYRPCKGCPETSVINYNLRHVTFQMNEGLKYTGKKYEISMQYSSQETK